MKHNIQKKLKIIYDGVIGNALKMTECASENYINGFVDTGIFPLNREAALVHFFPISDRRQSQNDERSTTNLHISILYSC